MARVHVRSLTTAVSTIGLLFEIIFILKEIKFHFKGSYDCIETYSRSDVFFFFHVLFYHFTNGDSCSDSLFAFLGIAALSK